MLDNPREVCYGEELVACPRCGAECRLAQDAEWFRCLKCYHEADPSAGEALD